jgi:hypothetical protein
LDHFPPADPHQANLALQTEADVFPKPLKRLFCLLKWFPDNQPQPPARWLPTKPGKRLIPWSPVTIARRPKPKEIELPNCQ